MKQTDVKRQIQLLRKELPILDCLTALLRRNTSVSQMKEPDLKGRQKVLRRDPRRGELPVSQPQGEKGNQHPGRSRRSHPLEPNFNSI